ncbi:MAG: TerD family protein [Muribaculaceae bacterium]|nr:TerD family protein [Muribaculaceae bacterium]
MEQWLQNMESQESFILELDWIGNLNIDLSALLVTEDGKILDEADFVYYNSRNRAMPYENSRFKTRRQWIEQTHPTSFDGSVELLAEDILYCEYSDYCSENLKISLSKVRHNITRIKIIASIYDASSNFHFEDIRKCNVCLLDEETLTPFASYNLLPIFKRNSNAKAILFAELLMTDSGKWNINILEDSFTEGLSEVVNKYVG